MALQFIDGFDHYHASNDVGFLGNQVATLQKWNSVAFGQMSPFTGTGRFGGKAMQIKGASGGGNITKNLPTPRDEIIVGFAYKSSSAHRTDILLNYDDTKFLEFQISGTALTINARFDTQGEIGITTAVITLNVWAYLEFRVKVHPTLGEVEVRVNNVTVLNLTNQNTGTGALIDSLTVVTNNNLQLAHMDDLYIADTTGTSNNDFIGDCRVATLYTNSDGGTNDFTLTTDIPTMTDNWDGVGLSADITRDRDHHYIESGLIGAREDFGMETLATIGIVPTAIFGVQVVNNCKKTATGVLKYKDEMTIAGTQYDNGVDVIPGVSDYHMSTFIRDTDPSDDATWTEAKVDAVGAGLVITERQL